MGYYIQGPALGKGPYITNEYGAREVGFHEARAVAQTDGPEAVVVVVDNGAFEAAGFMYDAREFESFTYGDSDDRRIKRFYIMDRKKACELSGYRPKNS